MSRPERPHVALVGCGRWGKHILRDLRSLGCDVTVVAREAQSIERAREGGPAAIVGSIAELPAVEGVFVATPTSTHAQVVREALGLGVPVFVEKPLTGDVESARELAELAPDRLFVLDKWRHHPGVRELARMAREGELGEVRAIHARRVSDAHRYADVDTTWIHLPHDLVIADEILGHVPEPRAAVVERMGDQVVSLVGVLGDPPVTVECSCVAPGHRRELRVVFEHGVANLDGGWAEELLIKRGTGDDDPVEHRPVPGELPLLAELREAVVHLRGGPAPAATAARGALVVERIAELRRLAGAEVPA